MEAAQGRIVAPAEPIATAPPQRIATAALLLRFALAACGGVAYGLGARPGGWPAVVLAFALLVATAQGAPTMETAAVAAGVWAAAAALAALPYLWSVGFAVAVVVAVMWAAAGLAVGGCLWALGGGRCRFLLAPLLVAAWETLRVALTNGLALGIAPVALVGTPVLPAAAWVGAAGLTVALSTVAAALWALWRRSAGGAAILIGCAAVLLDTSLLPVPVGMPVRVGAVQTWFTTGEKWNPVNLSAVMGVLERFTATAGREGAQLVVWPETAMPQSPVANLVAHTGMARAARDAKAWIAAGTVMPIPARRGAPPRRLDALVLVTPQNRPVGLYAKVRRVPFGEPTLATGGGYRTLPWGSVPIGPVIGWEALGSAPFRAYAGQGAQLAVAPVAIPWGWSKVREIGAQVVAAIRLRAAEAHLPVVLAANGPSAIIAADGRVAARGAVSNPGRPDAIVATVRTGGGVPGPFADLVWQLLAVAAVIAVGVAALRDPARWSPRPAARRRPWLGAIAGLGGPAIMTGVLMWWERTAGMPMGSPPVLAMLVVGAIAAALAWTAYGPVWGLCERRWGTPVAFALTTAGLLLIAGILPPEAMDWLRLIALWTGAVRCAAASQAGPVAGIALTALLLPVVAP